MDPKYYCSIYNENEKFIKNENDSCEIIQKMNGVWMIKNFPSEYPDGDENLVEISAQKYNKIKEKAEKSHE